jgi:hypothetical protein
METIEVVVEDIEEKVEDIEEEIIEKLTIAKMKDLLKAHIPKKNTLDSYCRTMSKCMIILKLKIYKNYYLQKNKISLII